ncbi:hypothetical protein I4U23_003935 [Adineta vaga]|nr:hypothetical protein I4U23_003935 [Adineta vaga]
MDGIYGSDSVTLVIGGYNIERSDWGITPNPVFTKDIIVLPAGWTGKGYSALVRLPNKDLKEVNNKGENNISDSEPAVPLPAAIVITDELLFSNVLIT